MISHITSLQNTHETNVCISGWNIEHCFKTVEHASTTVVFWPQGQHGAYSICIIYEPSMYNMHVYNVCVWTSDYYIYIYIIIYHYIYMRIYNRIYTLSNHITYVTLHGTWNTSGAYMKHHVPRFTVPFSEWKTTEKQSRCWSSLSTAAKSFLHTRSSRFALGCPMLSNACDNSKRQEKYWLLVPTPAYKSETQSLRLQILQKIVFQWGEC